MHKHNKMPARPAVLLALAALSAFGCASSAARGDRAAAQGGNAPGACLTPVNYVSLAQERDSYLIQPGDELAISFYLSSEFDADLAVRSDGKLSLQPVGEVRAAGLTPAQLSRELDRLYSQELLEPKASVAVKNSPSRVVYVAGEVQRPGTVALLPDMTALAAVAQSGGFTDRASTGSVVLIRRDACGAPSGEKLDLASAMSYAAGGEDAGLMPSDIIVVPRTAIADVGLFVKQYVRDLLPVSPYLGLPVL